MTPKFTGDHGDHGGSTPEDNDLKDEPHRHAHSLIGTKTLFTCHLTNHWWEPHMFQLVMEIQLADWAMDLYRKERLARPKESYFIANTPDDLMPLSSFHTRKRTSFRADVWRGIPPTPKAQYETWPWQGVRPLIADVPVSVVRVVYYRPFVAHMPYPETLTYILFGNGDEAHMTNFQTKEPEFDHILSLSEAPKWLPKSLLEAGILIDIPDIRTIPSSGRHCANPLPEGTNQEVRYRGSGDKPKDRRRIAIGPTYFFCYKIANKAENNPCAGSQAPCGSPPA
jgi:hypothetical protein